MDPSTATHLTNTTGTPLTDYYIYQTQNLPLLDPIRAIPVIGQPIVGNLDPTRSKGPRGPRLRQHHSGLVTQPT